MTEVGSYLLGQLTAGYTTEPIDYTTVYENSWIERKNGTIMPPSPGVKSYRIGYEFTGDLLYYDLHVEWRPIVKWLLGKLPKWQITHRSRTAVLSASPLRAYENKKRIDNVIEWQPSLQENALSASESGEIYRLIVDKTLKYLTKDSEYIRYYIKEHATSSFGGNFRWGQTTSLTSSEWDEFYNVTVRNVEDLRSNEGRFLNIIWKTGLRARSPSMDEFSDHFSGEIDRSRIITFHPIRSSWNIFLPNKKLWYKEILEETERILDVKPEVHYPYVEGGNIFTLASEFFKDGYNFYARDGKSWDASVGTILGKSFAPLMTYMRGVNVLPSGASDTSLDGTIANLAASRNMTGHIIILGDDNNQFTKQKPNVLRVPWIEDQPDDTKYKYILGVSFYNPDVPRIIGMKVMSDRADKNIPVNYNLASDEFSQPGRHTPQEISIWAGMYLGKFGDDTLINRLRKQPIEKEDYISPGKIMEDIIKKPTTEDPFGWAELEGIKKLVVA